MTSAAQSQLLLGEALAQSNRENPYPTYRRLREHGPLVMPDANLIVFSTFADCDAALRHPYSASDRLKSTMAQRQLAAGAQPRPFGLAGMMDRKQAPVFLFLDPPDHTRLRKLVSKSFVPKVISELEPVIVTLVDDLLDRIDERGEFDAVSEFAYPLALGVICRLLGVPVEDEAQFGHALSLIGRAVDPLVSVSGDGLGEVEERMRAGRWLRDYHRDLIARRRVAPADDLISALIAVEESGDQLTEEEIISTCNLLLIAGHESTVSLIVHAILALLRDRTHWDALSADARRAPRIVEEALRFDAPAQLLGRIAAEEMTIGDVTVPKGETMILLLAAAHRDPAANERPDVFDPDRKVIRHLGFGYGAHFCIGAPLVRLEASTGLARLAARFPRAELAGDPVYKPNVTLRGISSLPVRTQPDSTSAS